MNAEDKYNYDENVQGIIGLGKLSSKKSYFPELQKKIKELGEEKQKYKRIFTEALNGIFQFTLEGKILVANPSMVKICGYDSDLELKNINNIKKDLFIDPSSYDQLTKKLLKFRSVLGFETKIKRKDGEIIIVSINSSVRESDEKLNFIECIVEDITDKKNTEEKLLRSNQLLQIFITYSPAAVAMFDKAMYYIVHSKRYVKDYNLKDDNLVGKSHYEIFPELNEEHVRIHQKCLKGAIEKKEIDAFKRLDGKIDYVRWEIHPWYEINGEIGGIIFFSEVVTEKVKAELKLKERELLLSRMSKLGRIGGWEFDVESLQGKWTEEVAHIHEMDLEDEINIEKGLSFYQEEVKVKMAEAIENIIKKGIPFDLEVPMITAKGNNKWIKSVGEPVSEDGKITKVIGLYQDITNRKQAEFELEKHRDNLENLVIERTAELEKVNSQLEKSNKNLESFSYSVSHDLRTPLRAITGFTSILKEDYANNLDEEGQRIASIIQQGAKKMGELIDDLLTFSRVGRTHVGFSVINTNNLVKSVYFDLTNEDQRSKIKFNLEKLPEIFADLNMIRQVWTNLISNAIKYSSKKKHPIITIDYEDDEINYTFHIKDNGAGFNMKYIDKLFGVFQRLHSDNEFEGTGVGLALVKEIIEKHGGEIWAQSKLNRGTTFYFTIPKNN